MSRSSLPSPLVVYGQGEAKGLERVPLTARKIDEGWLQGLVFSQPRALPIADIDPTFAPILPIAREVRTNVGPIDALFVSPGGLLTIVEAKLWRNPEARREVVGQIIDYAKELATWNYEDVDQLVLNHRGRSLWELVSETQDADVPESEQRFVDEVTRNLERGRFLLLIVGDGIREGVERMTAFLQRTPHLHFTLALVEMHTYTLPGAEDLLIVPSIVMQTREVVRAVVRVEHHLEDGPRVNVGLAEDVAVDRAAARELGESDFREKLQRHPDATPSIVHAIDQLLELCREEPVLQVRWNSRSFAVVANLGSRLNGRQQPSMLTIGHSGVVRFHHAAFRRAIEEKLGVPTSLADEIHGRYRDALMHLYTPEVLDKVLNFHDGPRIDRQGNVNDLLSLLSRTVRELQDAVNLLS